MNGIYRCCTKWRELKWKLTAEAYNVNLSLHEVDATDDEEADVASKLSQPTNSTIKHEIGTTG